MFRSESSMGNKKPISRVEKNNYSDERENSHLTPIEDLLIKELTKPIESRKNVFKTPEHDENIYEETRRIIEEEEKNKLCFVSPVNRDWLDLTKEAFISSKNIESVRQQIKKLQNIRLKNIDDDKKLIEQLVAFEAGTPIYNADGQDPIRIRGSILALPIMTENTAQQYIYVGNFDDEKERRDRHWTTYLKPEGKHPYSMFTGLEFTTTNNKAIGIRHSMYEKDRIKSH